MRITLIFIKRNSLMSFLVLDWDFQSQFKPYQELTI